MRGPPADAGLNGGRLHQGQAQRSDVSHPQALNSGTPSGCRPFFTPDRGCSLPATFWHVFSVLATFHMQDAPGYYLSLRWGFGLAALGGGSRAMSEPALWSAPTCRSFGAAGLVPPPQPGAKSPGTKAVTSRRTPQRRPSDRRGPCGGGEHQRKSAFISGSKSRHEHGPDFVSHAARRMLTGGE